MGIAATQNLGRYLGVPLLHGRITRNTYEFLLTRLDNKLTGWKANNLSLAGRVTFASSILNSIPSYKTDANSALPNYICEEIDRKILSFIWGSTDGVRKIHNINWDTVCSPKSMGGLGLRSAKELNQVFLIKLVWGVLARPEDLWAKWSIRNGNKTRFWTDKWVDGRMVLVDHALNLNGIDPNLKVSDCCNSEGSWDLNFLNSALLPNAIPQVIGMSPPKLSSGDDRLVWGLEDKGVFSIKSAYMMLKDLNTNDVDSN
ncbi:Putative ribonuclease H protein At1g65750 [Linum perenne]